jgi:RND superfamily putative drug exporter
MSYLDREDSLLIGQDDSPVVIVGVNFPNRSADASMAILRRTTDALQAQLGGKYPGLRFEWTGEAAVNADMRRMSAEETRSAELRVLPVTLALLLFAFRSAIAAMLPILCGAVTILVSLGVIAALNRLWPVSLVVYGIVSMVGLGLSIDYGLLIVTRYRDLVAGGLSRPEAVSQAARQGGHTVIVSGSTVAIGFAAMLFVRVSEVRSIGMAGLIVTTLAVLVARTLLPVVLAGVGRWIDAGSVGLGRTGEADGHWRSWAHWVGRHPAAVLLAAGAPLLLLTAQAGHLRTDLPRGRWLPDSAESVRQLHALESVGRGNFGQMIPMILYLPEGTTIEQESGWRAESRLAKHFARDARIQHVWAVTTLSAVPLAGPETLRRIPDAVRHSLVSADGRAVLLQLLPRPELAAADAASLVREIRGADPQTLTGLAGTRLEVGGVPGFNVDYKDAITHSMVTMVSSVIAATLLVLSLAFRSVLIPVKAVALNLLSVGASFGAVAVVFQGHFGSRLVGLPRPLDGGFPIIPILVFCIVFGLSMDYEVFLVSRIAAGRAAGLSDRAALADALAGTGRVITFAAAIMVAIFGGFVFGNFVLIKILGFALGVAVLLDATVVRLALGPALIHLAGRWNWWPGD